MKLTPRQVKRVAGLANLLLNPEEEKRYCEQLSKILKFIEQLNQAETSNIEPTFNTSGRNNVTREDLVDSCFSQKEALQNALKKNKGFFVTKRIIGND
ncbi:Asp-tRNA(Asn)/Glu-tRNA(Gln) amidotransferase subunit GatC [Candidatus Daviesbacteria bacterium]|nr:Asp-tRNA(Asn)/Glu-tRNA(Gln) amidotransferase subunit GatC [Candidatus Daviesbacteria bacterium]